MDELIKSCLREIAFDGDYGCDASRLQSFISKFYSGPNQPAQNVDDGFRALVWSYIVQHPSVRVGFRPEKVKQDVYIADDVDRARGKGTQRQRYVNKGNRLAHEEGTALPSLDCLSREETESSTLDELLAKHGSKLRIAVDPEMCFQAVTGSTLTIAKLTPMAYTVLQLIARAREKGITFVELARTTGYSSGTIFYLVKNCEAAGIVKKMTTVSRQGTQLAVHMHFWENHPDWQKIQKEERRQSDALPTTKTETDEIAPSSHDVAPDKDYDDGEDEARLHFDPIDSRHLSRPDLIIGRVIKLLENSKNNCHRQIDTLIRIGFPNPNKTERRRFSKLMNEAVQQGIVERIFLPSKRHRLGFSSLARCLRLIPEDQRPQQFTVTETSMDADAIADADEKEVEAEGKHTLTGTRYLATLSLQRNLVDLVDASGLNGMTFMEIIQELGYCELRTFEHHFQKMCKPVNVLPHLSDLAIVLIQENAGRERRLRVHTARNFALYLEREALQDYDKEHITEDPRYSGGFALRKASEFYRDQAELQNFVLAYKPKRIGYVPESYHMKPGRIEARQAKAPRAKNPIGPDGRPKRGRPRKFPEGESRLSLMKRKREEAAALAGDERPLKKTRSSMKDLVPVGNVPIGGITPSALVPATQPQQLATPEPKQPARSSLSKAPQNSAEQAVTLASVVPSEGSIPAPIVKKKRGRPKKGSTAETPTGQEDAGGVSIVQALSNNRGDIPTVRDPSKDFLPSGGVVGGVIAAASRPWTKRKRVEENDAATPLAKRIHLQDTSPRGSNNGPVGFGTTERDPSVTQPVDLAPTEAQLEVVDRPATDGRTAPPGDERRFTPQNNIDVVMETADAPPPESIVGVKYERPRRRDTANMPKKANLSNAKRAQEILEILKRNNGVLHNGIPLMKAHHEYVKELEATGERPPGSAHMMDKRTLSTAIDILVQNKDIKVLTTSSGAYGQHNRALRLLYLPETPQESIDRYRRSLEKQLRILSFQPKKKIPEPIEYSEFKTAKAHRPVDEEEHHEEVDQTKTTSVTIAGMSSVEVRHHILESEPRTVAQLYGYIQGLLWRARELHLFSLQELTNVADDRSGFIVSRAHRIIDTEYFLQYLSVGTWCTIVPIIRYSPALEAYLHTIDGRDARLRDAPVRVQRACGFGYTRGRTKMYQILDVLTALQVVVPLEVTSKEDATITVDDNPDYPWAFRTRELKGLSNFPLYWKFNERIPIYNYAQIPAPLLGVRDVHTVEQSLDAWNILEEIAKVVAAPTLLSPPGDSGFDPVVESACDPLRRFSVPHWWNRTYRLSLYQTSCLRLMADGLTGSSPLQTEFGAEWLQEISYSLAAPQDVVHRYLELLRNERLARLNEKKMQDERNLRRSKILSESEGARFLATKARQTRGLLENSWHALVAQIVNTLVPGTYDVNAPELQEVKKLWHVRGGAMNVDNARDRIISAITGTAVPAIKRLERRYQPAKPDQLQEVPHCSLCEQHLVGIKALVDLQEAQQEAMLLQLKEKPYVKRQRSSRYTWTPEFDELALDAEAVIRARCGPDQQPAISLFEKLFPRLSANSVRTHLQKVRAERPGGTAYSTQLQAAWNALRSQPHADIPDPLPESLTHFPLERHIAYLRAHLDKSKLGVPRTEEALRPNDDLVFMLPKDLSYIDAHWDVISSREQVSEWDFMWTLSTDELRERNSHHEALTLPTAPSLSSAQEFESVLLYKAQAAVKMAVTPSEENYDSKSAAEMLHLVGEQEVAVAFNDLKRAGVIKGYAGDKKPASGRALAISEAQLDVLDGQMGWRLFRDAELLERDLRQVEIEPWSVLASDGRTAGLLDLISDNQVEITIDTSNCSALDVEIGVNSRKINDDNLENNIYVIATDEAVPLRDDLVPSEAFTIFRPGLAHPEDQVMCYMVKGAGLTNCPVCIDNAFEMRIHNLSDHERNEAKQLLDFIVKSGEQGVLVSDIQLFSEQRSIAIEDTLQTIFKMTRDPVPILFCVGYETGRLVSATFLNTWALQTKKQPFEMLLPRRWMNPNGEREEAVWQSSLRSVMGWIVVRPGISETALRQRSAPLFDRLEMNDILQFISDKGFATRKDATSGSTPALIGFSTGDEEAAWHWHIGHTPWYRIH